MQNKYLIIFILLFGTLLLLGCQSTTTSVPGNSDVETNTGYPILTSELVQAYPYPIENNNSVGLKEAPDFKILEPVYGGVYLISGIGPANVPITLIDVSEVGKILGTTIIDKEGNFTFELNAPVISGHSIGLQLGDITNTEFNEADFYYNDSYYDRPIVGTLFDMVTVK